MKIKTKQNNFSDSSEFSTIRVRRTISQCLGWVVESNSPGINKHHKTHRLLLKCKLSTSEPPPLTQDNQQALKNIPWGSKIPYCIHLSPGENMRKSREPMTNASHVSQWATGRRSHVTVGSPTYEHTNIPTYELSAHHQINFIPNPGGNFASVT